MPGLLGPRLLTSGGFYAHDTSAQRKVKYCHRLMNTSRVIAYIDGFNFYHGLRVLSFPPKRSSTQLKQAASAAFSIFPQTIQSNHLPDPVRTSGGVELRAPSGWLP